VTLKDDLGRSTLSLKHFIYLTNNAGICIAKYWHYFKTFNPMKTLGNITVGAFSHTTKIESDLLVEIASIEQTTDETLPNALKEALDKENYTLNISIAELFSDTYEGGITEIMSNLVAILYSFEYENRQKNYSASLIFSVAADKLRFCENLISGMKALEIG